MYFADLSLREYSEVYLEYGEVPIGWLDGKHPYTQGMTDAVALERLWLFCKFPVYMSLGYHECELCENPSFGVTMEHNSEKLTLGSREIRVLGSDGTIYAAPDLIYHYVVEHSYLPPQEFVEALIHGPSPITIEYIADARKYSWFNEVKYEVIDTFSSEDKVQYLRRIKLLPPLIPAEFKLIQIKSSNIGTLSRIKWSPDGSMLAANANDGNVGVWDSSTGELLKEFHTEPVIMSSLAWSQDGQFLGAASRLENAKIWNIKERVLHAVLENVPATQTKELAYAPNGKFLASYGRWDITIYQAQTLEVLATIPLQKKKSLLVINAIKWSNNNEYKV